MRCKFPSICDVEYESLILMIISITPVLVNRLVLSLKKAADIRNRSVEVWNAGRLTEWEGPETTVSHHPTGSRMGISRHRDIPLNLLTRHGEHVESSA